MSPVVVPKSPVRVPFLRRGIQSKKNFLNTRYDAPVVAKKPAVAGCCLVLLALGLYVTDPELYFVKYILRIAEGSELLKILSEKSETIQLSVYVFNVTNSERFLSGEDRKLKLQEIGPFLYREMRTNNNISLDSKGTILKYTPSFEFYLKENSTLDPADVNITVPNIASLAISSMLSRQSRWLQYPLNVWISKKKTKSLINLSAESYLWGYDEPLITLGNALLPGWIYFQKVGLLDRFLDSERPVQLAVGATNEDKFELKTVNGVAGMPHRGYGEKTSDCNTFIDGYEGTGYPPGMTSDTKIRIYRKVLCRLLDLEYAGTVMTDLGVKALKYQMGRDAFDLNGKNQCLCSKGNCMKGFYDASPCFYGFPLTISQPHFLDGDPRLFDRIEGLVPDPKLHGCEILIEPICGLSLKSTLTIQLNVNVNDVSFNKVMKPFANMMVPVAWFKVDMPPLKDEFVHFVRWTSNYGPKLQLAIVALLFVLGFTLIVYSVRDIFWSHCVPCKRVLEPWKKNTVNKCSRK